MAKMHVELLRKAAEQKGNEIASKGFSVRREATEEKGIVKLRNGEVSLSRAK